MTLGASLRWGGFWMLDALKGKPMRREYDIVRDHYINGTPKEYTEQKIDELIRHAVSTCDFYKEYAGCSSLTDFPIINKALIRDNFDAFVSASFRGRSDNQDAYTSGSTGTPFHIIHNKAKVNHRVPASVLLSEAAGYRIGMKVMFVRMWVGDHAKTGFMTRYRDNWIPYNYTNIDEDALQDILSILKRERVEVLMGYSSALLDLCRYIDANNISVQDIHLKVIIPMSESMAVTVRTRLSEQFGCPVRSLYSNEENGIMAVQGKKNASFRVDESSYHYEILKMDSDEPAEDGELGRIVITDLYNYAVPLIRYENGDMAIADHRISPDGRTRLYLRELYGRRYDQVYDTKGRVVSPFVFYNGLSTDQSIRQYQFIQTGEKDYVLEMNADPNPDKERELIAYIRQYFGEDAQVAIEYVAEIPVLSSGKRKNIVNKCPKYIQA